jgi:hypothetical protein
MNWSGYDSIIFKVHYFKSNTLGWGPASLRFIFTNLSTTDTVETEFTSINNWDSITVKLASSMISSTVVISATIGGGEGVGIDNIKALGYLSTGLTENTQNNEWNVFPNPAENYFMLDLEKVQEKCLLDIYNTSGQSVISEYMTGGQTHYINTETLVAGVYNILLKDAMGITQTKRLIIK